MIANLPIEIPVRTQNPRDYTVQIRRVSDNLIVGTGIVVSSKQVVTCAHVVVAAGVNPRKDKPIPSLWKQFLKTIFNQEPAISSDKVVVYFPQARGGEKKEFHATVAACFPDHDDDVVLLQLVDDFASLGPEQFAKMGAAEESYWHEFRSYGYKRLDAYLAGWADGKIQGPVEPRADRNVVLEPIQLNSNQINRGMSGAGVLDIERNLVVGIISEAWLPTEISVRDSGTAWAVNARVLSLGPLGFQLQDESLPLRAAPSPKYDVAQAEAAVFIKEKYSWNSAPSVLTEWTGRDDLLKQITEDWNNPQKHVTGLIGFGGEGKSSLARKWVETLEQPALSISKGSNVSTFDGLFWWGFYENRSIDEFLEAALKYLSGGRIDPRAVPSSSLRAQIIGAMLGAGRYLFVLDGLEVMQHQEGDQYGLVQSNDLRDLLTYFARPDNQSFCLITSRAPLLDLMEYTTYTHRDVDRLSPADGRALLRRLGVQGIDTQLDRVVSDWDGHALTISLLGSYLAEKHGGDIAHLAEIPIPTADEPRYERVHRVLRRYDEHLTETEREFLKLFSAFRTPVHEGAFEKVFVPLLPKVGATHPAQTKTKPGKASKQKKTTDGIDGSPLRDVVTRLVSYRILRHDTASQTYTAHPLVRNHYLSILTHGDSTQQHGVHNKIKDYYLFIAGDTPQYPTLDDLKPLIEVVHHACQAGAYDEAYEIRRDRIDQGTSFILGHQLGAYETQLSIQTEFFPDKDLSQEPQPKNLVYKRWILNTIGFCLMSLGRLREAVPFYERVIKAGLAAEDWHNISVDNQNLAELHAQLGALEASAEAARQALDLARHAENKRDEKNSQRGQAWAEHLLGNLDVATSIFIQIETLEQEEYLQENIRYLFSTRGINHADHLRRTGKPDYARRVTKANLAWWVKNYKWPKDESSCLRILGDLNSDSGNHESARAHYESALKIARSISHRQVLIEALLARGRFLAKMAVGVGSSDPGRDDLAPTVTDAFNDLNEALNYAVEGGYRIYEADIRVALAWAHLAASSTLSAKAEAERALQMSQEMGYHWGVVDAEEVLKNV